MTGSEAAAVLLELREFRGVVTTKLDALAADNARGEGVHLDHEQRLRDLEATSNQAGGAWRLLTAGGLIGASLVGGAALVLRAFGA